MDEVPRPPFQDRLRLVESLLRAAGDSMSPLQQLLSEVHVEIGRLLQTDIDSGRDQEIAALRREVEQLRDALVSRAVIERAKGILMQGQGLSEPQSFDLLNELSQRHRRKLRDIAGDVATGTLPPDLAVVRRDAERPVGTSRTTHRRARTPRAPGAAASEGP